MLTSLRVLGFIFSALVVMLFSFVFVGSVNAEMTINNKMHKSLKIKKNNIVHKENTGEEVGLNPQPVPPKEMNDVTKQRKVGLNPQPVPPTDTKMGVIVEDMPGEKVGLNPQPVPPENSVNEKNFQSKTQKKGQVYNLRSNIIKKNHADKKSISKNIKP